MSRKSYSPWCKLVALLSVAVVGVILLQKYRIIAPNEDLPSPERRLVNVVSSLSSSPSKQHAGPLLLNSRAEQIARLERIVDAIKPVERKTNALSVGFQWLESKPFDSVQITQSTDDATIEKAVFTFMKQLQITCPKQTRMGRQEDGGWHVCVASPFNISKPCLAYSIGMGGEWSFDNMITGPSYGCEDWTYDPTLGKGDHKPNPLFWFFNTGLGGKDEVNKQGWKIRTFPTLLKENNHTKSTIDILKMDIEYAEWDSLEAILANPGCLDNVKQLMIEYHTREMDFIKKPHSSHEDLLTYWHIARGLDRLGFKVWTFWNNDFCNFESTHTPGLKLCGCFNTYYLNTKLI